MPYASLRDFMAQLETEHLLVRVTEPVSTVLEMTEIQTRLLAEGGPAVLFENVTKVDGTASSMPVLVNLFGTIERVAAGMDRKPGELRQLGELMAFLQQPEPPDGLRQALDMLPLAKKVLAMRPKRRGHGPVQDVVQQGTDIDLGALPIQTCWPDEPAPLITWPLVVTKGPSESREDDFNLGIYRMQVLGPDRTLMRWLKHRGGAQHFRRWQAEKREPLPAAVVIGADPGTILAAVTPVPDTLSEYQFAGLLRGKQGRPGRLQDGAAARCRPRPRSCSRAMCSLDDYGEEGPYGDHTGYYNAVEKFPVFTDLRDNACASEPIYLSTFTGRPPDEPSVLGRGAERGLRAAAAAANSRRSVDFYLPPEGCSYRIAVVSIAQGLSGAREARDDGGVVLSAPVHVHEMGDRGGRRHRLRAPGPK